jgi:hypothetical protein
MFKCKICGKESKGLLGLAIHINKFHKNEMTGEEYYLKYIGEKGKCIECGKDVRFYGLKDGYNKFCSHKCSNNSIEVKKKKKETCLENSGYEYPAQNPVTREKRKKTCFENSGYEYPMQDPKNKEKQKQTCLENSGYENPSQDPKNKEKKKETCLENSGYEHPSQDPKNKEKKKETNLENSGYEYPMQNPETREKSKQTNLENSGYENPSQDPKNKEKKKETCLEKSGYENPSQDPKNKEKKKESILKNNNGIHPSKLTYKQVQERYPDVVEIEKLIEGPNGEIWGHCKNSSCKNSEENGGYFDVSKYIRDRNRGINGSDTDYFYCCEECKHSCPLFGRSAKQLHNLINENPEIPHTQEEYSTWKEEVYHRQRIENNTGINFCEKCQTTEKLHVHHIQPQKLEPGYALDPINGIVFCEDCHYKIGHEKGTECSTGNLASKICK